MFDTRTLRHTTMTIAAIGAFAATAPAFAKTSSITLPASAVKDDTSRVCMPRSILGKTVDKTLPQTICQTRDAWSAQGVTIVLK